jgi:hypothetical protein
MKPEVDKKTYRRIRTSIGIIGFILPLSLILGTEIAFFQTAKKPSISHYYYSNFREIFTGSLCAVGLFMLLYKGYGNNRWWKNDKLLTNIAGLMAFVVAFVPTEPETGDLHLYSLIPLYHPYMNLIHLLSAATLFISFSILSFFAFTEGSKMETRPGLMHENNIYRFCGLGIVLSILIILVFMWNKDLYKLVPHMTLYMETLALFFFATSWLIKGRALGDTGKMGRMIYSENN